MPRMLKINQNSMPTIKTLPISGRLAKRALTTTFSSGTRLITRNGRSIRSPLKVLTNDMSRELKLTENSDRTTMMKSRMFHPSLRYECLSRMKPRAMTCKLQR